MIGKRFRQLCLGLSAAAVLLGHPGEAHAFFWLFQGGAPSPAYRYVEPRYVEPSRPRWSGVERPRRPNLARRSHAASRGYEVPAMYRRQTVPNPTKEQPGTIVVDTKSKFLYLVLDDGQAIRYGVSVGREGFAWRGVTKVGSRAEWPAWTPPPEMRRRKPSLPLYMAGGPKNPLGARALYLHRDGKDTMYRIHGTTEPWSIGRNASSGCIRMLNEDVIDLYDRVSVGIRVVVL